MRKFLPKSLLGQMLLAVALALLVAQAISVMLLVRAEQQRTESAVVNELAFQLVAGERGPSRPRAERRWARMEQRFRDALAEPDLRDITREAQLRSVLEDQGVQIEALIVVARDLPETGVLRENLTRNPRLERRWGRADEVIIAGLTRVGEQQMRIARAPRPRPNRGVLGGLIIQTAILYFVLVGGLALLLRRMTRPIAQLTERVENFDGGNGRSDVLEPSGPDDARRLITAHNAMEARIAALLDEKNVMLGAIGHDLKTPLAALRVRIESVENETERARMAATIEDITTSLDDILSLARVGQPTDPLEHTDLSALVASVVEEYEDMGDNAVLGDNARIALPLRATWLRRALRNLIGNALRYGEQARVSLAQEDGEAVIRIADTGPGIPDAQIAAMMEPFARGEGSRNRETGGAGLGLTLARAIAEQHGGTLALINRIGEDGAVAGLLAELRLPL